MITLTERMAARGRGAIVNVIGAGGKVASPTHLSGGAANAATRARHHGHSRRIRLIGVHSLSFLIHGLEPPRDTSLKRTPAIPNGFALAPPARCAGRSSSQKSWPARG